MIPSLMVKSGEHHAATTSKNKRVKCVSFCTGACATWDFLFFLNTFFPRFRGVSFFLTIFPSLSSHSSSSISASSIIVRKNQGSNFGKKNARKSTRFVLFSRTRQCTYGAASVHRERYTFCLNYVVSTLIYGTNGAFISGLGKPKKFFSG